MNPTAVSIRARSLPIQRYEATEYASANLARVIEISQVLGLKLLSTGQIEVALKHG
jgi:hypothetical protein